MLRAARTLLALAVAATVAGAAAPIADTTHLKLIVGVTDDTGKWLNRQDSIVAIHKDLRLMAVRVTMPWRPGQTKPRGVQKIYVKRIARMLRLNDRIILSVYSTARFAPLTRRAQAQYCGFLRAVNKQLPLLQDFQIWNEANSPTYWPQDLGSAAAYERLLARCWDALHRYPGRMNVISSTAPHHDPASFIVELGDAYRSSGRDLPIFDTFGHNPYPENAAEPPSTAHTETDTISEGDYDRLMHVLDIAFDGSAQPVPGTKWVGVWYLETGFQTTPPRAKRRFYRGRENDPYALPAFDQASQLRAAVELAYCQPAVTGFFNFQLIDEDRLAGWQSGLLWRDRTRKPSYEAFKDVLAHVRKKDVNCSKVAGTPAPPTPNATSP